MRIDRVDAHWRGPVHIAVRILAALLIGFLVGAAIRWSVWTGNWGWAFWLTVEAVLALVFGAVMLVLRRREEALFVILLGVALAVVPQVILVDRLIRLQDEALSMASELQSNTSAESPFEQYEFRHPELKDHFTYSSAATGEDKVEFGFWVGTPSILHVYSTQRGWFHEQD